MNYGYTHKGKVLDNGVIAPGPANAAELLVRPEDDGQQIADYRIGDFEWWYFDIIDQASDCFLQIALHIGTDPLRTRIVSRLAILVVTPERSESFSHPIIFQELEADTLKCNISAKEGIKIRAEFNDHTEYFISLDIPLFKCNLNCTGDMEGWKPLGNEIRCQTGKKKGAFSWVVPIPRARVEGSFFFENKNYVINNGIGYHDHNYIKVNRRHPLYLDDLAIKWYWGKCYSGRYTVVFMDTHFRRNRILSLLVAENSSIIYNANNSIECSVTSSGYDNLLNAKYPEMIKIRSTDDQFHFQAEFECVRILDRKDLLKGVNRVFKYLIKKLVARPVYHVIYVRVKLKIKESDLEGYGNIESMVFRDK